MPSALDFWLRHLDNAAEEADLDGRKWNPRRDDIKHNLTVLIDTGSTDGAQELAEQIITHIEEHQLTPSEGRINMWMMEIIEEQQKPAGAEGHYNLYRDDENVAADD